MLPRVQFMNCCFDLHLFWISVRIQLEHLELNLVVKYINKTVKYTCFNQSELVSLFNYSFESHLVSIDSIICNCMQIYKFLSKVALIQYNSDKTFVCGDFIDDWKFRGSSHSATKHIRTGIFSSVFLKNQQNEGSEKNQIFNLLR